MTGREQVSFLRSVAREQVSRGYVTAAQDNFSEAFRLEVKCLKEDLTREKEIRHRAARLIQEGYVDQAETLLLGDGDPGHTIEAGIREREIHRAGYY